MAKAQHFDYLFYFEDAMYPKDGLPNREQKQDPLEDENFHS